MNGSGMVLTCFWTDFQPKLLMLDRIEGILNDFGPTRCQTQTRALKIWPRASWGSLAQSSRPTSRPDIGRLGQNRENDSKLWPESTAWPETQSRSMPAPLRSVSARSHAQKEKLRKYGRAAPRICYAEVKMQKQRV